MGRAYTHHGLCFQGVRWLASYSVARACYTGRWAGLYPKCFASFSCHAAMSLTNRDAAGPGGSSGLLPASWRSISRTKAGETSGGGGAPRSDERLGHLLNDNADVAADSVARRSLLDRSRCPSEADANAATLVWVGAPRIHEGSGAHPDKRLLTSWRRLPPAKKLSTTNLLVSDVFI